MASIEKIINDECTGLLPHLQRTLEGDWDRFQLRAWNFMEPTNDSRDSGIRIREGETTVVGYDDFMVLSAVITIGKVITLEDQVQSQVMAGVLREDMDEAIVHWSTCITDLLQEPVQRITGANDIEQDSKMDSGDENSYQAFIIREFTIKYGRGFNEPRC